MKKVQQHQREDIDWKGYSIDELRYQRAYTLARLEIQKEKITSSFSRFYSSSSGGFGNGLIKKITGSLNYVDYALLAYKIGNRIYKLFR